MLSRKGVANIAAVAFPLFYPLIELTSMTWAILAATQAYDPVEWAALMVIGGICIVASAIDLRTFLLPDVLTYSGTAVVLFVSYTGLLHTGFVDSLIGGAAGAVSMWTIAAVYKLIRKIDGLGMGNVKFMLMLGALVGWRYLSIFVLVASVCALLFSIITLSGKKRHGKNIYTVRPFSCGRCTHHLPLR